MAPRSVLQRFLNVLVTGVTGLIGGEIVRKLSAEEGPGKIFALIRPREGASVHDRLRERMKRSVPHNPPALSNVEAVAGDITRPGWGLCPSDLERVLRDVDLIIHNAADTSFAPNRDPSETNVPGTEHLIEMAQRCARRPLIVYMSTASNCGKASHCVLPEADGCRPDNEHFNVYTQSKAVSETLLRTSGLPVLTLRPTIVLPARLPDPVFAKQILWCVPLTKVYEALPLDPASRLDLVDVDHIVQVTLALLRKDERRYDCYNLSAGQRDAVTVGETIDAVAKFYRRKHLLQAIPPDEWGIRQQRTYVRSLLQRRPFRALRHYLPFLNMDVVYDNARIRDELGAATPPVEPFTNYIGDLLRVIRPKAALEEAMNP